MIQSMAAAYAMAGGSGSTSGKMVAKIRPYMAMPAPGTGAAPIDESVATTAVTITCPKDTETPTVSAKYSMSGP